MINRRKQSSRSGQSLIELLIAVTVGAILVGSAALVISVTIRVSRQNEFIHTASFLSQELVEKVSVFSERAWFCPVGCTANLGLYNLAKGSGNPYHLDGANPLIWDAGTESPPIVIEGVSYTRHFYVQNVCRDEIVGIGTGDITGETDGGGVEAGPGSCDVSGGTEDPSTQKLVVVVGWPEGGSMQVEKYLTRHGNQVMQQTDWSGGVSVSEEVDVFGNPIPTTNFDSHTNVNFSIPGSITIQPI